MHLIFDICENEMPPTLGSFLLDGFEQLADIEQLVSLLLLLLLI